MVIFNPKEYIEIKIYFENITCCFYYMYTDNFSLINDL